MNNQAMRTPAVRAAALAAPLAILLALSACGGGGGNPNAVNVGGGSATTGGDANANPVLTLGALSASATSIQAYDATTLSVDVLANGVRYTGKPVNVTFSSACATAGKATLAAAVTTIDGTAQTVYRDKGCASNDVVTVAVDGVEKSVSTALSIAPPAAASIQFAGVVPANQSIVIQGQGGSGRTETAVLTFKVLDIAGNPLAGRQVSFSATTDAVRLNKTSDATDATGSVVTTVNSGSVPTSFRVRATLPGTGVNGGADISTLSDSVAVSNGVPTSKSFSISAGAGNVEGWTVDSALTSPATRIQVLLADAFGNPVPDGTPIAFQTNLGAVGSSSRGGCNTANGGCTVDFRAQNPRTATPGLPATPCNTGPGSTPDSTRPGLATICASTTDGVATIAGKIAIFLSGSFADKVYLGNSRTPLGTSVTNLGSIAANTSKGFWLELNDQNDNPLPAGSKVDVTNAVNVAAAAPAPATVPNIFPHIGDVVDRTGNNVSGRQGYAHWFSISAANQAPPACATDSRTVVPGSFQVTVTTPGGSVTSIPFTLSFTCP